MGNSPAAEPGTISRWALVHGSCGGEDPYDLASSSWDDDALNDPRMYSGCSTGLIDGGAFSFWDGPWAAVTQVEVQGNLVPKHRTRLSSGYYFSSGGCMNVVMIGTGYVGLVTGT